MFSVASSFAFQSPFTNGSFVPSYHPSHFMLQKMEVHNDTSLHRRISLPSVTLGSHKDEHHDSKDLDLVDSLTSILFHPSTTPLSIPLVIPLILLTSIAVLPLPTSILEILFFCFYLSLERMVTANEDQECPSERELSLAIGVTSLLGSFVSAALLSPQGLGELDTGYIVGSLAMAGAGICVMVALRGNDL